MYIRQRFFIVSRLQTQVIPKVQSFLCRRIFHGLWRWLCLQSIQKLSDHQLQFDSLSPHEDRYFEICIVFFSCSPSVTMLCLNTFCNSHCGATGIVKWWEMSTMLFKLKELVTFPSRFLLIQRDWVAGRFLFYILVVKKFQTVTRRPRLSLLRLKYFAANLIALPA